MGSCWRLSRRAARDPRSSNRVQRNISGCPSLLLLLLFLVMEWPPVTGIELRYGCDDL